MYLHLNTKNKAIHIHICSYKYPKQKPYQAPTNSHILLSFPLSGMQSFSLSLSPHSAPTHLGPPFLSLSVSLSPHSTPTQLPPISVLLSLHFCHNVHASEQHQSIANSNVDQCLYGSPVEYLDPDPRTRALRHFRVCPRGLALGA
jgi:hypothetical protein